MDDSGKPAFAPKCIWCNAEWNDSNVRVFDFDASDQCESGRFEPENVTVAIVCHVCNREMYRKEGVNNSYGDYDWHGR